MMLLPITARILRHYKIFCVNGNTGFRNESRIFYFIHLQNEGSVSLSEYCLKNCLSDILFSIISPVGNLLSIRCKMKTNSLFFPKDKKIPLFRAGIQACSTK